MKSDVPYRAPFDSTFLEAFYLLVDAAFFSAMMRWKKYLDRP